MAADRLSAKWLIFGGLIGTGKTFPLKDKEFMTPLTLIALSNFSMVIAPSFFAMEVAYLFLGCVQAFSWPGVARLLYLVAFCFFAFFHQPLLVLVLLPLNEKSIYYDFHLMHRDSIPRKGVPTGLLLAQEMRLLW